MLIADLRHRVIVKRSIIGGYDGCGGENRFWFALGTLWAEIRPTSGRESQGADSTQSTVTHEITVRVPTHFEETDNDAYIMPSDRIEFGSRVFDVESVRRLYEKDELLKLACIEVVE